MIRSAILAVLVMTGLAACTTRDPLNPLDPDNPITEGSPQWLSVLADDEAIDLEWDVPAFDDLVEVRVVSEADARVIFAGPPGGGSTRETNLVNGVERSYRIELSLEGGRELVLPGTAGTPGPAVVWAIDDAVSRLRRLTPDGLRTRFSLFTTATDLAVDPDSAGLLLVDFAGGAVELRDRDGVLRWRRADFSRPVEGLRWDGGWWVTDAGSGTVTRLDDAGRTTDRDSSFVFPWDLAPAGPGAVWVADRGGAVLRLQEGVGVTAVDSLVDPIAVAGLPDGGVWVVEQDAGRVLRLDAGGGEVADRAGFIGAVALAADPVIPSGVWVSDRFRGAVLLLDADAAIVLTLGGLASPADLVVSPDGSEIWVGDTGRGEIVRFGRDGAVRSRSSGVGRPRILDIAFAPFR